MVRDNERMLKDTSVVNKQQSDKPHGYDVPNAWPFPVFPPKPWTDEQLKEYNDKLNEEAPL